MELKKQNTQQPQDQDQRVEEERRENEINRSGSGEPAGSRTAIKGHKGPVLFISSFPSLSKVKNSKKKREKLSPLSSKAGPEKMKWEAAGASPARWPAVAPPRRSFHFIFFLKIFTPKAPSSSPLSYSHTDF